MVSQKNLLEIQLPTRQAVGTNTFCASLITAFLLKNEMSLIALMLYM